MLVFNHGENNVFHHVLGSCYQMTYTSEFSHTIVINKKKKTIRYLRYQIRRLSIDNIRGPDDLKNVFMK